VEKDNKRGAAGVLNLTNKMDTSIQVVEISLLRYVPELVAWVIGLVLAIIMVRQGGGKAEKLLLAGCSLMFLVGIISVLLGSMTPWLLEQRISAQEFGLIRSISIIPSLAGFICLILAFFVRFKTKKQEAT